MAKVLQISEQYLSIIEDRQDQKGKLTKEEEFLKVCDVVKMWILLDTTGSHTFKEFFDALIESGLIDAECI